MARRKSYGLLRHSQQKIKRAALRWGRHGWGKGSRKFRVIVTVQHSIGMSTGRGHYHAFACVGTPEKWASSGSRRCSGYVKGSTPTKAMNAALRALAKRGSR